MNETTETRKSSMLPFHFLRIKIECPYKNEKLAM